MTLVIANEGIRISSGSFNDVGKWQWAAYIQGDKTVNPKTQISSRQHPQWYPGAEKSCWR